MAKGPKAYSSAHHGMGPVEGTKQVGNMGSGKAPKGTAVHRYFEGGGKSQPKGMKMSNPKQST